MSILTPPASSLSTDPLFCPSPQVGRLKGQLLGALEPKRCKGCALTGPGLVALLRTYVEAMNSGGVPSVGSAWGAAMKAQSARAVGAARERLEEDLAMVRETLPAEEAAVRAAVAQAVQSATGVLKDQLTKNGGAAAIGESMQKLTQIADAG